MTDSPPQPNTIARLVDAVYPSFALLAGMELDVFTPLKDGPLTAREIAEVIHADADRLSRLLYALVAAKMLTVDEGRFSNTPESNHYLVRGRTDYQGGSYQLLSDVWHAMLQTAASVRTGTPQTKHDFLAMTPEELEAFLRGLHTGAVSTGRDLALRFDFSARRTLLDVGGGSGGLSIALTETHPHIRATVAELPTVTPITERFIRDAGAAGRVSVLAVDVVDGPVSGSYDAAAMRAFTQVLSAEQNQRALRHAYAALTPGGVLYISARVLDDTRTSPPDTATFNLVFLNLYEHGQAYTEGEYRLWLADAGFINVERIVPPRGDSILVAHKPDAQ